MAEMKLGDKIAWLLPGFVRSGGYEVLIPNFYYGMYEMDLFRLTASEMVYEYEIKISRSDYFNDFKKQWAGITKHSLFETKKCDCNRFYFVVPDGLIKIEEVPVYAGLIYFKNNHFEIVKVAPLIHKNKSKLDKELYRYICKRLAFRETHHKIKYRIAKYKLDDLTKENNS